MPPQSDSADRTRLRDEAINWLIRLRSEELSDAEMTAFANWLAEDYHHSEAFAFAEDLFDDMRQAALTTPPIAEPSLPHPQLPSQNSRRRTHRRWLRLSLASAALWLLAVILIIPDQSHPLQRLLSDHHTGTGEIREIRLSDGSQIQLDTNTAVSLQFDAEHRRIVLHHGRARFSVAKDPLRPFEVLAGNTNSRALGTVFDVNRIDDGNTSVTVQQHAVRFTVAGEQSDLEISAGQRLQYRHGDSSPSIETVDIAETSAWQQHRLIINDRPLGELITELNRYRLGRIFLSDAALGQMRISGVFSLDNPDAIPTSIVAVLGLKETRLSPWWTILHR